MLSALAKYAGLASDQTTLSKSDAAELNVVANIRMVLDHCLSLADNGAEAHNGLETAVPKGSVVKSSTQAYPWEPWKKGKKLTEPHEPRLASRK